MPDFLTDYSNSLKNKRIDAPVSFADDVMNRIERQSEGGLKSMSVPSRILLSTAVLVIYCSLGVLLGLKGYRDMRPDGSVSSQEALVELMDSHYMRTDLLHDPLFRNFVCQ
jgi:hypothetical protein